MMGARRLGDAEAIALKAVNAAIAELANFRLLADPNMDAGFHETYVDQHRAEYERTVSDVLRHYPRSSSPVRVLEIGAFFGVVCIALASLGYDVTAADVPEYIDLPEQAARYARFGIKTKGVRLQDFVLPFEDEQFDVIIMCEVLEHLNFNPLPLLKEINRIGRLNLFFTCRCLTRPAFIIGWPCSMGTLEAFKSQNSSSSSIPLIRLSRMGTGVNTLPLKQESY